MPEGTRGAPFGDYQLTALLGEGGMAQVFLAERHGPMGFRKELAIKRLRAGLTQRDDVLLHSLVNEARLGGQLKHPNVVDTYEFGVVDGQFYIAMEYVRGATLRELVDAASQREVRLPLGAVLDLAIQICAGLHYAHRMTDPEGHPLGLVHRDLKPRNVIVSTVGLAKLMDFGIARSTASLFHTTGETTTKGTLVHMSPEQVQDPRNIDARADIFALGTVIFEALTGTRMLDAPDASSLIYMLVSGSFRAGLGRLEWAGPEVAEVVARCVEMDRDNRYPDALELGRALRRLRSRCGTELGARELMDIVEASRQGPETLDVACEGTLGRDTEGPDDWLAFVAALRDAPLAPCAPMALADHHIAVGSDATSVATWDFDGPAGATASSLDVPTHPRPERIPGRWLRGSRILAWALFLVVIVGGIGWWVGSRTPALPAPEPSDGADADQDPEEPTPDGAEEQPAPDEEPGPGEPLAEDPPPQPIHHREQPARVTPVLVRVNSDPWSVWQLDGDATASGVETPFERPLAPGAYVLTLTEPHTGAVKALPLDIHGDEEEFVLCWSFSRDGPC